MASGTGGFAAGSCQRTSHSCAAAPACRPRSCWTTAQSGPAAAGAPAPPAHESRAPCAGPAWSDFRSWGSAWPCRPARGWPSLSSSPRCWAEEADAGRRLASLPPPNGWPGIGAAEQLRPVAAAVAAAAAAALALRLLLGARTRPRCSCCCLDSRLWAPCSFRDPPFVECRRWPVGLTVVRLR